MLVPEYPGRQVTISHVIDYVGWTASFLIQGNIGTTVIVEKWGKFKHTFLFSQNDPGIQVFYLLFSAVHNDIMIPPAYGITQIPRQHPWFNIECQSKNKAVEVSLNSIFRPSNWLTSQLENTYSTVWKTFARSIGLPNVLKRYMSTYILWIVYKRFHFTIVSILWYRIWVSKQIEWYDVRTSNSWNDQKQI